MSWLLIAMCHPHTPPGLLAGAGTGSPSLASAATATCSSRTASAPALATCLTATVPAVVATRQVRFHQPLGNPAYRDPLAQPEPGANLPGQFLLCCRDVGSDRGNKGRHLTVLTANPAWVGEARGECRIQDPAGRPAGRRHRGPVLGRQDDPGLRAGPAHRHAHP